MLILVKQFVLFLLLAVTLGQVGIAESAALAHPMPRTVVHAAGVSAPSHDGERLVVLAARKGGQFRSVSGQDAEADALWVDPKQEIEFSCWGIALFFAALSIVQRPAFVATTFDQPDAPPLLPPPRLSRHRR